MPLYLDVHHRIEGLTGEGLAGAHQKDLEVQHKYGVNYLGYLLNRAFLLVDTRLRAWPRVGGRLTPG